MTFSIAAASRSLGRLMPATSPATYAILTLSCLLYGVSLLRSIQLGGGAGGGGGLGGLMNLGGIAPQILDKLGASEPLPYNLHAPWRFITAVFLHGSLMHIGFNMWVLMDIGPQLEEIYGSARYLFIYVLTGAFGFVFSSALSHFSVGGSGALLGLIGVLLAVTYRRGGSSMQMLRSQLIKWIIYIGVLGFLFAGTDNAAHFGGLVSGFLLGKVMADREPMTSNERTMAYAMGWIAALAIVGSFAALFILAPPTS
jgi:rhomboid protease GluP